MIKDYSAYIGQIYHFLKILKICHGYHDNGKKYPAKAFCECKCGNKVWRAWRAIARGQTKSCGCLTKELTAKNNRARCTKHGHTKRTLRSSEYRSWHHMKERCLNPKNKNYDRYGARGIKICKDWIDSFESFFESMGEKPEPKSKYSLDRINNDGNYESGNCRWATQKEQVNNSTVIKQKYIICCFICNKEIVTHPSRLKTRKYCDRICQHRALHGKLWKTFVNENANIKPILAS